MALPNIIPYGKLSNGKLGFFLEDGTGTPLAAALEVLTTLPSTSDTANFPGRLVFAKDTAKVFSYSDTPSPVWNALEGVPASVGAVSGSPPVSPLPETGSLFWDTDTEILFLWDGSTWKSAGGQFAAQFIEVKYTGDGFDTTFSMGTTAVVAPEQVEVFLDGIRQRRNPGADYDVVGTNVVFSTAPQSAVTILIRSLVSDAIVQNAQAFEVNYTATALQTDFSVGTPGVDPAGVLVIIDGVVLTGNGVEYNVSQQNTTINSITAAATVATATTAFDHNLSTGFPVTISGVLEADFEGTFTVTGVPTTKTFTYTVGGGAPSSATPDPIMSFSPPYANDTVSLITPLAGGETVNIKSFKGVVTAPTTGEANVLASIGTGESLVSTKVGIILQLKSLIGGANVTITDLGNELSFSVSSLSAFENRVGVNTSTYTVTGDTSYVGVRSTTNPVTISLTGLASGPSSSGRRVTIKDESGGAGINNITVNAGGTTFDGQSNYIISSNYGAVTVVTDGTSWFITNTKV